MTMNRVVHLQQSRTVNRTKWQHIKAQ